MIGRLRVAHRLLLIYVLSLASVVFLVYRLIDDKDRGIDLARRELQAVAYIDALRAAAIAVAHSCARPAPGATAAPSDGAALADARQRLAAAEATQGEGLATAAMAAELRQALDGLAATGGAAGADDPSSSCAAVAQQIRTLVAQVAERSSLIADPQRDSFYVMSIDAIRMPEIVVSATLLADLARRQATGEAGTDDARGSLLLVERGLTAALLGLGDAVGTAARIGDAENGAGNLVLAYQRLDRDMRAYLDRLRAAADAAPPAAGAAAAVELHGAAIGAADELWRQAAALLDGLLRGRIDQLQGRMLTDLGIAAAISLLSLVLIVYVARGIARPIRELAQVAAQVHSGAGDSPRASAAGGDELGTLVDGFNAMLDRLEAESERQRDLAAREQAAAAQREILETMPAWLAVIRRADGATLYANRAAAGPAGAGDDGPDLMERLQAEDRAALIGRLAVEDRIDGWEARLTYPGPLLFWVLVSARPLSYAGEPCALVVFTPVDALKRAEMEREQVARRLIDAIESLAEGFALYDSDDTLIACNEPYRRMNEVVRDLLVPGVRWVDLVRAGLDRGQFADVAGREESWLADRLADRRNADSPIEVQLAGGRWLRAVDRRTRDGGLVSLRFDVTEQKHSAERLRTSEAFKSAIINAALDSIVTIDEEARILEFNPAAEQALGRSRDEVLGKQLDSLIIPEHLRAAHRAGLARFLAGGESKIIGRRLETEAQRADGVVFPIELAVTEVALDGRRAFVAYLRDITARRATQAELARRASMLDAVSYTATEIVSGVDWQRGIRDLLQRLGLAADVSRVTLFEAHRGADGRLVQSCRYDWAEPGLPTLADDPRYHNMPLTGDHGEEVGEWTLRRQRGEVIQATLSQTTGYTRDVFEEHGTLSFLSVPIMVSGAWWGFLGFDDCRTERVWTEIEIDVLRTSTALISGAIERARAEERLRLSEQRYALAARGANDGLWDWDLVTETAYFSPRLHEILGLADGALGTAPSALFDRVAERDLEGLRAGLETRIGRRRQKFELECRMRHQAGGERWMVWRGMIVYGPDKSENRPVRIVGSLHDITERKTAEERLRESEARFRAIADDAPVLLDLMDADHKLVFANRQFLQFHGRTLEEVSGDGWMSCVHPDDLPGLIAFSNLHVERRDRSEVEYRLRRHDGEYRWIHETQAVRYDVDGRFAGFVDAIVDVTDRRHAEAEVARQREALHQSEKLTALGSLLAGVAHELNNPLSVVVGQAMLLEETAADARTVGRSETIRRAAERCSRIVRTFLTLARRRQPEQSRVSLNATIEMAVELLAYQLRISEIDLELSLAPDLPDLLAEADQLHQIVTNLIVNAEQALADAPRPRRLRVETRLDAGRGTVVLTIADNGPGIGPEIRPRIFEPFFTTKPLGQGTGIGLAMCRNIVTSHRGSITVVDTPGGGATFVVELPVPAADALGPLPPAAESERPRTVTGCRVLVVDDEAEIAETLVEILASAGHRADIAANGRQALDRLAGGSYDVILSDLRMPVLDGPGLYAALAERHPAMTARIAFITGDTLSARLGRFLAETGVLCLEKPFTPDDVRLLIADVLAQPPR